MAVSTGPRARDPSEMVIAVNRKASRNKGRGMNLPGIDEETERQKQRQRERQKAQKLEMAAKAQRARIEQNKGSVFSLDDFYNKHQRTSSQLQSNYTNFVPHAPTGPNPRPILPGSGPRSARPALRGPPPRPRLMQEGVPVAQADLVQFNDWQLLAADQLSGRAMLIAQQVEDTAAEVEAEQQAEQREAEMDIQYAEGERPVGAPTLVPGRTDVRHIHLLEPVVPQYDTFKSRLACLRADMSAAQKDTHKDMHMSAAQKDTHKDMHMSAAQKDAHKDMHTPDAAAASGDSSVGEEEEEDQLPLEAPQLAPQLARLTVQMDQVDIPGSDLSLPLPEAEDYEAVMVEGRRAGSSAPTSTEAEELPEEMPEEWMVDPRFARELSGKDSAGERTNKNKTKVEDGEDGSVCHRVSWQGTPQLAKSNVQTSRESIGETKLWGDKRR